MVVTDVQELEHQLFQHFELRAITPPIWPRKTEMHPLLNQMNLDLPLYHFSGRLIPPN